MTVLVTGSTGTIGAHVIEQLVKRDVEVRALVRSDRHPPFPDGVVPVRGDMTDLDSVRSALSGIDTLFLLNAVVPDELTQALITLDLARAAGVRGVVYFSVLAGDVLANVPHFASKYAVERAIEVEDQPATILRPAYFMQNDMSMKDALLDHGVYPMPVGSVGVAMADARDIAEVAAIEIARREQASEPLPRTLIPVAGPEALTGERLAAIWSETTGRTIAYGGDDLDRFEAQMRAKSPAWMAYDMRTMLRGFQRHGMTADQAALDRLVAMLGRPVRSYGDFAREAYGNWRRV